jgi:hypothetical protein
MSGRYHPIPSFLNDNSLNDLIAKENQEEKKNTIDKQLKVKVNVEK